MGARACGSNVVVRKGGGGCFVLLPPFRPPIYESPPPAISPKWLRQRPSSTIPFNVCLILSEIIVLISCRGKTRWKDIVIVAAAFAFNFRHFLRNTVGSAPVRFGPSGFFPARFLVPLVSVHTRIRCANHSRHAIADPDFRRS